MQDRGKELNILWLSPLPPIRSGVADYAVELLPELGKLARVRVVEPPGWSKPAVWPSELELVPTDATAKKGEIVVVHLGNNPYHDWLLERLQTSDRLVVVLHDLVLHHLLVESASVESEEQDLADRLRVAHGEAGVALAAARRAGHHGPPSFTLGGPKGSWAANTRGSPSGGSGSRSATRAPSIAPIFGLASICPPMSWC